MKTPTLFLAVFTACILSLMLRSYAATSGDSEKVSAVISATDPHAPLEQFSARKKPSDDKKVIIDGIANAADQLHSRIKKLQALGLRNKRMEEKGKNILLTFSQSISEVDKDCSTTQFLYGQIIEEDGDNVKATRTREITVMKNPESVTLSLWVYLEEQEVAVVQTFHMTKNGKISIAVSPAHNPKTGNKFTADHVWGSTWLIAIGAANAIADADDLGKPESPEEYLRSLINTEPGAAEAAKRSIRPCTDC